ncbi:MAG: DNA polymerase III subunit delta [Candidatus Limnocylindria bacterium]
MADAPSPDADLLLAHGDDGFELDAAVDGFADRIGVVERTELVPERRPDERVIERAAVEVASIPLFGGRHVVVLRQPLQAVGAASSALERLVRAVRQLPPDGALALVELRPSRDVGKTPAALARLSEAVGQRGGRVEERNAPRRRELIGWIQRHAAAHGIAIEPPATAILAERVGGAVWEGDIERGEQTRVAAGELRKLVTYVGERAIRADDVDALTADTRPSSIFAITNAIERRERAAAAEAVGRALDEGQPVLLIMATLQSRISDLIVTRDLLAQRAPPEQIAKRLGRPTVRAAERVVEAAKRYSGAELEAMLRGLLDVDVAIKNNVADPGAALAAWFGEFVLAGSRPGASVQSG